MTQREEIRKTAFAIRKECGCGFVEALIAARWLFNKASWQQLNTIKGFELIEDCDYSHDIDLSVYLINGKDISRIAGRALHS